MAVAFRSATTVAYASGVNTVLTPPTGLANGDILLATVSIGAQTTAPTVTPPAGFTQIGTTTSITDPGGFNVKTGVYWKRAASESGNYTFTSTTASRTGTMMAFSGCVTSGSPVDVSSQNTGTGTTLTGTGVTTTNAADGLVYLSQNWGDVTGSDPTGFTAIANTAIARTSWKLLSASGATGNITATPSGSKTGNPWAVFMVALLPAGGGVANTLTAALGTFSLSGQASSFLRARSLTAALGTFSQSGKAANLLRGRTVLAAQGTYSLSGQATSFQRARSIIASLGTYSLSGKAALTNASRSIIASQGTYTLAGIANSFIKGRGMAAATGTYAVSGIAATINASRSILASKGTYTLSGKAALTNAFRSMNAIQGTYALSGKTVTFTSGKGLLGATGSFSLSGKATILNRGVGLTAAKGTYVVDGQPAVLTKTAGGNFILTAASGVYLLSGKQVSLDLNPVLKVGGKTLWQRGVEATHKKHHTSNHPHALEDKVKRAAQVMSSLGGQARAKSLTPTQRSNIATKAANARWR